MKEVIIRGVQLACERWTCGDMGFEAATKFLEVYVDDSMIDHKIAEETLNYFRMTRDLEKTQAMIMKMRLVKFNKEMQKQVTKATLSLTIPGREKKTVFLP